LNERLKHISKRAKGLVLHMAYALTSLKALGGKGIMAYAQNLKEGKKFVMNNPIELLPKEKEEKDIEVKLKEPRKFNLDRPHLVYSLGKPHPKKSGEKGFEKGKEPRSLQLLQKFVADISKNQAKSKSPKKLTSTPTFLNPVAFACDYKAQVEDVRKHNDQAISKWRENFFNTAGKKDVEKFKKDWEVIEKDLQKAINENFDDVFEDILTMCRPLAGKSKTVSKSSSSFNVKDLKFPPPVAMHVPVDKAHSSGKPLVEEFLSTFVKKKQPTSTSS